MQILRWDNSLELGLEQVDAQHKQLINMINELNIAVEYGQPNSSMLPIVVRLQKYADSHFKTEEEIFAKYGYPDRLDHEAEHVIFIDKVKYIRRQCQMIDTPMSAKIRDFLLNWFCNHIRTRDMEYKKYIEQNGATETAP
jgi:hemerythrin-like metal-binding protein